MKEQEEKRLATEELFFIINEAEDIRELLELYDEIYTYIKDLKKNNLFYEAAKWYRYWTAKISHGDDPITIEDFKLAKEDLKKIINE